MTAAYLPCCAVLNTSATAPRPPLLIGPVHVAVIKNRVQRGGGVAEDVAHGGESFGLRRVDERHACSDDFLGTVVQPDALVVVEFLTAPYVKLVQFCFPWRGRLHPLWMPQRYAALQSRDKTAKWKCCTT